MKKITFKNIFGILLITFIIYQVYQFTNEYLIIKNYQYGENYNSFRVKNGIPEINEEMEPFKMPVDNNWGMIWINENQTKEEKPLIHRTKIINASEKDGWNSENDSYLYFINDTTNYILSIDSKKLNSKIDFEYKLMKTDSRKKEFKDYQENKYEKYSERKLEIIEADSIKIKWKIN
ncbi:hypothetical protein [Tenacibaculum finnmarkense]|uniref:hypothetical protein n=1 Tax=Tenacibaculum finnmarkense TaxID=2781243 RepID=UPI001E2D6348|nr:hypothetical protein [Tenacibaculum finnmarkense]MCD8445749.1 hypothetical protein [Tenacibaculum finnmarkense genomovar ulcerans]